MAQSAPEAAARAFRQPLVRIAAAAVLAPVALLCVLWGTPAFEAIILLVVTIVAFEWCRMCAIEVKAPAAAAFFASVWATVLATAAASAAAGLIALAVGLVVLALVPALVPAGRQRVRLLFGLLYIALPALALVWIRNDVHAGALIVLWLLVAVWASDVGAYAAGSLLGGPKLAPAISPNKTWSGVLGGLVLALVCGSALMVALGLHEVVFALTASAMVGAAAQAGDLLESWIKRRFGVKDTGTLIPGHGGVLDRVDSMMGASLVVALFTALGGGG
jgi:phosphatidate cytidylyltransferase